MDCSMSVTMSARNLPIRSQPTAKPVAGPSRAPFLSGRRTEEVIPRKPSPRGEHRARGAEENIEGGQPDVESTQENLKRLEGNNPVVAALASVISISERSSLPPSETGAIPAFDKLANAKVKAWRKAGRTAKGKETTVGLMFRMTRGRELEIPYSECDACALAHS